MSQRGLVCPEKAQEFDELHAQAPRFGRNSSGARELAGGYTKGEFLLVVTFEWNGRSHWGGWPTGAVFIKAELACLLVPLVVM